MFKNSDDKLFWYVDIIKTMVIILALLVGALAIFYIVVGDIITGVIYFL